MQDHRWRENEEDGTRFYKASYHAERWTMESQLKGEEEWTPHDPMKRADWEMLRDVLFRKYQRKRCPWKIIEAIDKRLEKEE